MYRPEVHKHIGNEVRANLVRREKTATALAEYMQIQPTSLSRKLSGDTPFSIEQLIQVEEFIGGITAGEILINARRTQMQTKKTA